MLYNPVRLLRPRRLRISLRPRLLTVYALIVLAATLCLAITMYLSSTSLLTAALGILSSVSASPAHPKLPDHFPPTDPLQVYNISANNITASFIGYGARLTSLLVPDRNGKPQDIAVGYDDPHQYVIDSATNHTNFGSIVGRYANRIKNGTFELDGVTYDIPKNELNDTQTLHGGKIGYDQRNWTVTSHTSDSVTFTLFDSGFEGFPGHVINHATFSVKSSYRPGNPHPAAQMTAKLVSFALTEKTPIMLSPHIYWNLNGFKKPTVLEDTYLQLPLSSRFIDVDSNLIPTGKIGNVSTFMDGALDFVKPKLVGRDIEDAEEACGPGCTGYDHCFIVDRPKDAKSSPGSLPLALKMSSSTTGINMLVRTNQPAIQIYSCNAQNGTIPVKPSQVERNQRDGDGEDVDMIEEHGCLVVETEGWIDGINNPEWGQDSKQIFSPKSGPAVNLATYVWTASQG